jgi:hypothetical protein
MIQQFADEGRVPAAGILWDWQIIEALQENIKSEQISARPDGKDYVEWHEATRIANRVFGPLGWSLTTTMTPTLLSAGDWGEGFYCTRKITVRYRCSEDKEVYTIERDGEGWIKLQAIGKSDALDMAFKGAASDAISKATKTFGDAFGLSLYAPKGRHGASAKQNGNVSKPTEAPKVDEAAARRFINPLKMKALKAGFIAGSSDAELIKAWHEAKRAVFLREVSDAEMIGSEELRVQMRDAIDRYVQANQSEQKAS